MPDVENFLEKLRMFIKTMISLRVLTAAGMATLIYIALMQTPDKTTTEDTAPIDPASVQSPFLYTFNEDGILLEAYPMSATQNPYWWLDSGGKLMIKYGVGETIQNDLPRKDPWYAEYARTNAEDTDGGVHPQNLLRLVSRSAWNNVRVEASFFIVKDNLSASANRNESNGLLLMSRYSDDGQTLYYAGIRVDGTAVIKKKYKGTYYTMDQKNVFTGSYDRENSPNLLPHSAWIRLRSDTVTNKDGSVTVTLYMQSGPNKWKQLLSALDDSQYDKTPPITGERPIGLRTDFMDVKFDDILMEKLQ